MAVHDHRVRLTYADDLLIPEDGLLVNKILDGEHYVTASPSLKHQTVSRRLMLTLGLFVETNRLGEIFSAPTDVVMSFHDVAVPDLVFVSRERLSILTEANIQGAPDLVVEILSKSTRKVDQGIKFSRYEPSGSGVLDRGSFREDDHGPSPGRGTFSGEGSPPGRARGRPHHAAHPRAGDPACGDLRVDLLAPGLGLKTLLFLLTPPRRGGTSVGRGFNPGRVGAALWAHESTGADRDQTGPRSRTHRSERRLETEPRSGVETPAYSRFLPSGAGLALNLLLRVPRPIILLAGLDPRRQPVLLGRQRAGGEGGEGAGRVVGGVEVHHHLAVLGRVGVQEAAGAVGLFAVGLSAKIRKSPPSVALQGVQPVGLALQSKTTAPGRGRVVDLAEDVGDRDLLGGLVGLEAGVDPPGGCTG